MALSSVTITYDIADLVGTDFDARRTKVYVTINTDSVIDTEGNKIRVGDGLGTIASDGTGSVSVWVPGAGSNPTTWQTYVHIDYAPRSPGAKRETLTYGPFTITAAGDLADLVQEQVAIPTATASDYADAAEASAVASDTSADNAATSATSASSSATAAATSATEAEAAAALAEDISNIATPDALVETLIENPASLTATAVSAAIGTGIDTSGSPARVATDAAIARQLGYAVVTDAIYSGGADPTGVANSRAAFVAAAASGKPVWLGAGTFKYDGAGLAGLSNPVVVGAGVEKSIVALSAGSYFLTPATAMTRLHLENVTFEGGAGVIRDTWVGVNVNGHRVIRNVRFHNYTGAAIASDATDEPYWDFENCQWDAANETTSIGVALAGSADGATFYGCSFLKNRIDVKLRRCATVRFDSCDFLPFGPGDGVNARAAIWFTPVGTQGFGASIHKCKFGNENIAALDKHIVIADDSAPSGHVGDSFPVLSANSTGTMHSMTFSDIQMHGAGVAAPPLIYSTTPDLRGFIVGPVKIAGSAPVQLVEFRTPPTAGRLTQDSIIGPVVGSDTLGTEAVPLLPSNAKGWAKVIDPQGVFAAPTTIRQHTAGDPTGYVKVLATAINSFVLSNCTKTTETDAMGGTDAIEMTYSSVNGFGRSAALTTANIVTGRPVWIEFDLKVGATSPLTAIKVNLQYTGSGAIHWQKFLTIPTEGDWVRYRRLWVPRETTTNIFLQFVGPAVGTVKIGRVRMYHAHEPVPERLALPDVVTTTTAPAAGAAGALPATPAGYVTANINGTPRQIPYY